MTALANPQIADDGLTLARALELKNEMRSDAYRRGHLIWLYVIQAGEDGPVKIGMTKGQPRDRLRALQQGSHETLRGLAAWRALLDEEKVAHRGFAYARLRGEWFKPVPELIQWAKLNGADFDDWEAA